MDGGARGGGSATVRKGGGTGVAIDFDSFLDGLAVGTTIIGRGAYGECWVGTLDENVNRG